MDEPFVYVKKLVVNFKLDYCCYVAPVRVGLLITAYFNIMFDLVSIVGMGDDSFKPTIMEVQESILEDNASKPIPILCYAAEFACNVVLLAAIYRKDTVLLRVYMYCCFGMLTTSIMFYSVVIVVVGVLMKIAMVLSILFQCYVIILIRSAIVELKIERKNGELPTLVMSSLVHETKDKTPDVEAPHEAEKTEKTDTVESTEEDDEKKKEVKLETVQEHPKEEV